MALLQGLLSFSHQNVSVFNARLYQSLSNQFTLSLVNGSLHHSNAEPHMPRTCPLLLQYSVFTIVHYQTDISRSSQEPPNSTAPNSFSTSHTPSPAPNLQSTPGHPARSRSTTPQPFSPNTSPQKPPPPNLSTSISPSKLSATVVNLLASSSSVPTILERQLSRKF